MSGQGPDDVGNGFGYLLSEIQPTTKHKIILFAIDLVLASVLWTIVIFLDIHWPGHPRYRRW